MPGRKRLSLVDLANGAVTKQKKSVKRGRKPKPKAMKTVTVRPHVINTDIVMCMVCKEDQDDHLLVLCESCDTGAMHIYCSEPKMRGIPRKEWYCPECLAKPEIIPEGAPVCCTCKMARYSSRMALCDTCGDGQHTFCCTPVRRALPVNGFQCSRCEDAGIPYHGDTGSSERQRYGSSLRKKQAEGKKKVPAEEKPKNRRGRKLGSKNKPKVVPVRGGGPLIMDATCNICGKGTDDKVLMLCDTCPTGGAHIYCTTPKLRKVPTEPWSCDRCTNAEDEDAVCQTCGKGNNAKMLLLCDTCPTGASHTYCCTPRLNKVPESAWYCDVCTLKNKAPSRGANKRQIGRSKGKGNLKKKKPGPKPSRKKKKPESSDSESSSSSEDKSSSSDSELSVAADISTYVFGGDDDSEAPGANAGGEISSASSVASSSSSDEASDDGITMTMVRNLSRLKNLENFDDSDDEEEANIWPKRKKSVKKKQRSVKRGRGKNDNNKVVVQKKRKTVTTSDVRQERMEQDLIKLVSKHSTCRSCHNEVARKQITTIAMLLLTSMERCADCNDSSSD